MTSKKMTMSKAELIEYLLGHLSDDTQITVDCRFAHYIKSVDGERDTTQQWLVSHPFHHGVHETAIGYFWFSLPPKASLANQMKGR